MSDDKTKNESVEEAPKKERPKLDPFLAQWGSACVECGHFVELPDSIELNSEEFMAWMVPNCPACGGKTAKCQRAAIKKLVQEDRRKRFGTVERTEREGV